MTISQAKEREQECTSNPNTDSASFPTTGAAQAATAISKERSNA